MHEASEHTSTENCLIFVLVFSASRSSWLFHFCLCCAAVTSSQFSHGQIYMFTQAHLSIKWNSQHDREHSSVWLAGPPNQQQRQQQWRLETIAKSIYAVKRTRTPIPTSATNGSKMVLQPRRAHVEQQTAKKFT